MAYGPFKGAGAFAAWVGERVKLSDPFSYAVLDAGRPRRRHCHADGNPPGAARHRGRQHRLRPALQRTPLATEAHYLLARYAFEELGYRRYEWKCDSLNAASRRAALRFGFTFEGIFRQHMIIKGRNRDTAWFSMLDSEWPARKRNFERWLAPDNFDRRRTAETKPERVERRGGMSVCRSRHRPTCCSNGRSSCSGWRE